MYEVERDPSAFLGGVFRTLRKMRGRAQPNLYPAAWAARAALRSQKGFESQRLAHPEPPTPPLREEP